MASKTQRRTDDAIDAFVARVNGSSREPLCYDEVPEFLRERWRGGAHR